MPNQKAVIEGSPVIPFSPALGVAFGVCGALLIQQIHYWTSMGKNHKEGHNWCYNTYEDWSAQLGVYSAISVRRTIKELEASGVLVVSRFNKMKYDRTRWYRIDYDALSSHLVEITGSCGKL